MTYIVIIVGVLLIFLNIRFVKDKDIDPNKKDEFDDKTFRRIYEDEEMDTTAVDVIIGELRVEFSETVLDLQKEIIHLNQRIDEMSLKIETCANNEAIHVDQLAEDIPMTKMEEIGMMLKSGYTIEELCEKFQMGRGEISLIEKLHRK